MTGANLIEQPETLLPAEPEVIQALNRTATAEIATVVAAHPKSSLAWSALADYTHSQGRLLEAYAYARVGYHRGLDALRKAGWRGQGPIPWSHEPNRGVLRALFALRRAAAEIGESDEFERLTAFLEGADPTVITRLRAQHTETQMFPAIPPAVSPDVDPAPPTAAFFIQGEN